MILILLLVYMYKHYPCQQAEGKLDLYTVWHPTGLITDEDSCNVIDLRGCT